MDPNSIWTLLFLGAAVVFILSFKIYVHLCAKKASQDESDSDSNKS